MECHRGLDLILHTPGGFPEAAESIVKYLRSKFSTNIRVIVPHLSMSAGTMSPGADADAARTAQQPSMSASRVSDTQ